VRKADFSLIQLVTPTTRATVRSGLRTLDRHFSIRFRHGHHRRTDSAAARFGGKRRLGCVPNGTADLHRLRHQHPRTCEAVAPAADGLIVGSALVRRVGGGRRGAADKVLRDVGEYVATLLARSINAASSAHVRNVSFPPPAPPSALRAACQP